MLPMLSTPQNSSLEAALAERLAALRQRLADAARAAGRDVDSITLLAVSKGHETGTLRAALALGIRQFGENYLEEALPKIQALRHEGATVQAGASGACPVWHFIGRLQANKTRLIAEHFDWVHGVDRMRIAERLSGQRPHHAPPLNVCVQVNIAGEAAKGGAAPADAPELLTQVATLPGLRLRGLMGMLPFEMPVAEQRQAFAALRLILERANAAGLSLDTLSMGMSGDFEQAIAEGATIVRIGTALFGPRG